MPEDRKPVQRGPSQPRSIRDIVLQDPESDGYRDLIRKRHKKGSKMFSKADELAAYQFYRDHPELSVEEAAKRLQISIEEYHSRVVRCIMEAEKARLGRSYWRSSSYPTAQRG